MAVLTFSTIYDQSGVSFKWILIGLYIYCSKCMVHSESSDVPCGTNIYLEVGKQGTVPCNFQGFELLGWINGDGYPDPTTPIIYFENSQPKGRGYEMGEYNILSNGSLIINNVELKHEFNFTVFYVPPVGASIHFIVPVRVFVKPFPAYPVVNEVTNQQFLVQEIDSSTGILTCAMNGVWPAVHLEWVYPPELISMESETTVTGNEDSTSNTLLNSTFTVHGPSSGSITVECVVAGELSSVLPSKTTIYLLVQRDYPVVNGLVGQHHVVLEITQESEISCSMNGVSQGTSLEWLVITPAVSNEIHLKDALSRTSNEDGTADVMLNSSLSVTSDSIGRVTLRCQVTGESADDFQEVTTVELLLARSTNFPIVNGQSSGQHLVLHLNREDELNCTVNGVSEDVSLEWVLITPDISDEILLEDKHSKTTNEDGTFNVQLNTHMSILSQSVQHLTMECRTSTENGDQYNEVTTIEVLVSQIRPGPEYPVVNGLTNQQYIYQEVEFYSGPINCTMNGVRPGVDLEWVYQSDVISMENETSSVTNNTDGTYNTSLSSRYTIRDRSVSKITLQCKVAGEMADLFPSVTTIYLLNLNRHFPQINGEANQQHLVLQLNREDEVTCSLDRVLQGASLEWVILSPKDEVMLDSEISKINNGDGTFNIALRSKFIEIGPSVRHVVLQCGESGPAGDMYPYVTTVEVLFSEILQIPVIDGCYSQQEDCSLTMPRNGTLACSVRAVPLKYRMDISLDISADASGLSLTRIKDHHHPHTSGDRYDLTTSYQYTVDEGSTESVIKCSLSGMNNQPMDSTVIARITWQDTLYKQKTSTVTVCDGGDALIMLILLLNVVFLIIIVIIIVVKFKKKLVKNPEKESVPKSKNDRIIGLESRARCDEGTQESRTLLAEQTPRTETDSEVMFRPINFPLERLSQNAERVPVSTCDDSIILDRSHHNSSGRSTGYSSTFDMESVS